jgi:hypothetical protein
LTRRGVDTEPVEHSLGQFIKDDVIRYLDTDNVDTRRAAALCCAQVMGSDPVLGQGSNNAVKLVNEVLGKLLTAAIADPGSVPFPFNLQQELTGRGGCRRKYSTSDTGKLQLPLRSTSSTSRERQISFHRTQRRSLSYTRDCHQDYWQIGDHQSCLCDAVAEKDFDSAFDGTRILHLQVAMPPFDGLPFRKGLT